jgi:hypothetical protein
MQVKLVPDQAQATADKAATSEWFLAAGIGCLVTEDWSSQGSVQLFRVSKERTQAFDGSFVDKWTIASAYRREFPGPVTALASSFGRLVIAFGHNVRKPTHAPSLHLGLGVSACASHARWALRNGS